MLCCDVSEEWTSVAQRYWKRAGLDDRIVLKLGPALETLRRDPGRAPDRPRVHRRRQAELQGVLRDAAAAPAPERRDPRRQHAVGRRRDRPEGRRRQRAGDPRVQRHTSPPTTASRARSSPSVTASPCSARSSAQSIVSSPGSATGARTPVRNRSHRVRRGTRFVTSSSPVPASASTCHRSAS